MAIFKNSGIKLNKIRNIPFAQFKAKGGIRDCAPLENYGSSVFAVVEDKNIKEKPLENGVMNDDIFDSLLDTIANLPENEYK